MLTNQKTIRLFSSIIFLNVCVECLTDECEIQQQTCNIQCTGSYNANWSEQMKQAAMTNNCLQINLVISYGKFTPKTLPSNWLEGLETNKIHIRTIKFSSCDFQSIAPKALNIKSLESLHFVAGSINFFKKEYFGYLPALSSLDLESIIDEIQLEAGLLENLPKLATLQIVACIFQGELISNITGINGTSTNIEHISLGFNAINSLPDYMIMKAHNLRLFHLYNNGIKKIAKEAFRGVNVQKIDLHANDLTTLEDGTFDDIRNDKWSKRTLILHDNPWRCDCHLKWLQDLYLSPDLVVIDPVPKCDTLKSFKDESFICPVESTTVDSSSSVATPSIGDIVDLKCTEVQESNEIQTKTKEFLRTVYIAVAVGDNQLTKIDVYNLDYNPEIELFFSNIPENTIYNLVYFENFDSKKQNCVEKIHDSVLLSDLQRNHTYTFCLVLNEETKVAPSSCFGLQIPPDWDDRLWIANKNRIIVIASLSVGLLICIVVSIVGSFFVIRSHPSLIDGNKDVVILKHGPKMPAMQELQNFERPEYAEPIQMPVGFNESASGYMTPASGNYEKVNYYSRTMNSTYGGQSNSYIRPGFSGGLSNHLRSIDEIKDSMQESYIFQV